MLELDPPTVLLLDGDSDNTLQIAKELSTDLDARIVGVGSSRYSRLFYSKYCDDREILPPPESDEYGSALLSLLRQRRPDIVLPVGYKSVRALDSIRSEVPADVATCLPESDSLEVAVDKRKTLALAAEHGIQVPAEYTEEVATSGQEVVDRLPFPLFIKARRESGEVLTEPAPRPATFWQQYDDLRRRANGRDVLVQEYVPGDGRTYGCGLLFADGEVQLLFAHEELRSVPRHGGSGTRLRVFRDPHIEAASIRLLEALDWNGIALVEFRHTDDGYVLMEINPKFWASYALASQSGYRFASTLVAETLDLPRTTFSRRPARTGERVFPLRELAYWLYNREEESLLEVARAMLWPPARPDINVEDLPAWLVPPVDAIQNSSRIRRGLDAAAQFVPGFR